MTAAKHFDIVLGLDFHMLRVPFFITPCPITPFGALVFDPMDYIHVTIPAMPTYTEGKGFSLQPAPMGGTVTVNGFYRGGATTSLLGMPPTMPPIPAKFKSASAIAKKLSLLHLVLPKPLFWFPFLAPHDGQISMGSSTVISQGLKQSTHMDPAWSCNELGKILMNSPTALYNDYATRIMIVLPLGRPVIVGGARVYPEMGLADLVNALIMMGILKGGGKLARKGLGKALTKLNKALSKKFPKYSKFGNRIQPKLCKYLGEPVDAASGHVYSRLEGFAMPGPLPLNWEASYYSDSKYEGSMGKSIIHSYDISLYVLQEDELVVINDNRGRGIAFSTLIPGEREYNRQEKYTLYRDIDTGEYYASDNAGLYYYFQSQAGPDGLRAVRSIVNRNGFAIRFTYDTKGLLKGITDSAGRQMSVHSDAEGRITAIEIPHPSEEGTIMAVRYVYNDEGYLTTMIDEAGASTQFTWRKGLLASRRFKEGTTFEFDYDGEGRCIAAEGPGGFFSYHFRYSPGYTIATNSLGQETHYRHLGGIVIRQLNPEGGEKIFSYDADQYLVAERDEVGITRTWEYDDRGNCIRMGLPGRGAIAIEYNEFNLPVKAVMPNKAEWTYSYDESGNLLSSVNPEKNSVDYQYHNGLLHSIKNLNGLRTEFWYDAQYNLEEVRFAENRGTVKFQYDKWGNCIRITDPNQNQQLRKYDIRRRLVQVIEADGNVRRFSYDINDNPISASDHHTQSQFVYNFFGDIVRRMQGGAEIEFGYDTEGRLSSVKNERDEYFRFEYDGDGHVIRETGFDGLTRSYFRDLAGKVINVEKPSGASIHYEYNSTGQVSHALYSDGSLESYEYDAMALLSRVSTGKSQVEFIRDKMGRVIEEVVDEKYKIKSDYNTMGHRVRVRSSLGADIRMKLEAQFGMVEQLEAGPVKIQLEYSRTGRLHTRSLPGGLSQAFEYDKTGRLLRQEVRQEQHVRHQRKYAWEQSRLKSITDSDYGKQEFSHDVFGNLSQVIYGDGEVEYRMPDSTGNLFETPARSDRKYGKGGRLLRNRDAEFDYDANGNLSRKTMRNGDVWEYRWSETGTLAEVIRPDKESVLFGYDALGRRTWKKFKQTLTRWIWDGNNILHEWKEFDTRDTTPDDLITWIFEQNSGAPSAKIKGDKGYSLVTDHLGTPVKGYSDSGQLIWSRDIDSYGRPRQQVGDEGFCPYLYQGQYVDTDTGLCYNRFRYYDPETGIYISQDPIGLKGGLRPYSYVPNPFEYIDRYGLNPVYYPLDELGRATGGFAEVTQSSIGTGTDASVNPEGWKGGLHPYHQQRSHLIAANHGGIGSDKRNIVPLTSGANHPGMRAHEDAITAHVNNGNTVLVEVKPVYEPGKIDPVGVRMYAIDQNMKVIVDDYVPNGRFQRHRACGCGMS
ncbi:DNA/RNA non-specific endonuclease [Nostoc ellipsosporum NOK]|nr:DNA/RNA non-specific endonuclease [Nostoc ellipsosporum NOK]